MTCLASSSSTAGERARSAGAEWRAVKEGCAVWERCNPTQRRDLDPANKSCDHGHMTRSLSKAKLKPQLLKVMREVQARHEEIIITDRGRPVLKLSPYRDDPNKALAWFRGKVRKYVDPTQPVGVDDWEALR